MRVATRSDPGTLSTISRAAEPIGARTNIVATIRCTLRGLCIDMTCWKSNRRVIGVFLTYTYI